MALAERLNDAVSTTLALHSGCDDDPDTRSHTLALEDGLHSRDQEPKGNARDRNLRFLFETFYSLCSRLPCFTDRSSCGTDNMGPCSRLLLKQIDFDLTCLTGCHGVHREYNRKH
jgi:hypothetical protein